MNQDLWKTKLAARIHDPAEKALVLLRDPAGHEGGSIVGIGQELGFETHWVGGDGSQIEKLKLSEEMDAVVKQADHWAAAADRAQFPKDTQERYIRWAQVRFAKHGELIHPLSGERYKVPDIGEQVLASHIKTVSEDLFKQLIQRDAEGVVDHYLTVLAFWRFGPELGRELEGIGHLWSLLPADTRTPDHTIWQHLDLVSAFAGALADGHRPALLTVSLGPVQDFIAAGRSTSDLWAGSHFLSTLAWQAMKVVIEKYGPDAILFPQLRAVPVVDLWLIEQGLQCSMFEGCAWKDTKTDSNPLFSAALPNKFVAIVPEGKGEGLAVQIKKRVSEWVLDEACAMLNLVLDQIGEKPNNQHCYSQLKQQLRGFPEVHWSLVPWLAEAELEPVLKTLYPDSGERPGFFGSPAWNILREPIDPSLGWRFWEPNDGALYPSIYDVSERMLAASKSARAFDQLSQNGYRNTLTGIYEWLTLNKRELDLPPGQREEANTLWARVAKKKPSWAKKGEHLSALDLVKRLWPTRYVQWLKKDQSISLDVNRYVVSTDVMALAPSLEKLMKDGPADEQAFQALTAQTQTMDIYRFALPRGLMRQEYRANKWWETASKLPSLIEVARECAEGEQEEDQIATLGETIKKAIGAPAERYYALIIMDGDRLGAWLSGAGECTLEFRRSFHSGVCAGLEKYDDERLKSYLRLARPASPARHMAISSALNGFSLDLVRHVVEDLCLGKLLYSGGDDVLAMVSVRDLLRLLWLLRRAYSGGVPVKTGESLSNDVDLEFSRGFVQWDNKLYRMMGELATASAGAVIAHHMTPLGVILRSLRAAEKDAKSKGGRNAFSIRTIKRSGGGLDLTLPWWLGDGEEAVSTIHVLDFLRGAIAMDVSRRVAYHSDEWMRRFPWIDEPGDLKNLIACNLEHQFGRKGFKGSDDPVRIAKVAVWEATRRTKNGMMGPSALASEAYTVVQGLLFTAEFLAREARGGETEKETAHV